MKEPVWAELCFGEPLWAAPKTAWPPPPLASFFGLRSRTLRFFFFVDFDISAFLFWVVGCFCCLDCVSDAEQKLTSAGDILFWNQIIEANQFFFSALRAGTL